MTDRKKKRGRSPRDQGLIQSWIVEAALELIDTKGYASFSPRDVARELNVYPPAIYWHIANRDALLVEVILERLAS